MDQVIKISEISSLNRHVWVEARITINQYPKENKSVIKGALYGCYENQTTTASTVYFKNDDSIAIALGYSAGDITKSMYHDGGIQWSFSVDGGSTGELLIKSFPDIGEEVNNSIAGFKDIHEGIISTDDSKVPVYVVPTNEELMIATDTYELIK